MPVAVEHNRRTVAGMEARLEQARKLIEKMRDDAVEKREATGSQFELGASCGLDQALKTIEWAFSPETDWMYRRP